MKTFGQVLREARKKAGITQRKLAARLKREDGRPVDPPYLNAVEHDHRYPPEDYLIEQMARIVGVQPMRCTFTQIANHRTSRPKPTRNGSKPLIVPSARRWE